MLGAEDTEVNRGQSLISVQRREEKKHVGAKTQRETSQTAETSQRSLKTPPQRIVSHPLKQGNLSKVFQTSSLYEYWKSKGGFGGGEDNPSPLTLPFWSALFVAAIPLCPQFLPAAQILQHKGKFSDFLLACGLLSQ